MVRIKIGAIWARGYLMELFYEGYSWNHESIEGNSGLGTGESGLIKSNKDGKSYKRPKRC